MKACLLALTLGLAAFSVHAEIAQKFGPLEIHYNAISTDELLPEVARAYKIERSKTRGLVTLSVLKKNAVGGLTPMPAKVSIYATNPSRQLATIAMREVREGTAIYYLGEFRMALPDTLKFTASVEVAGEPKREISFDQKFYK
ncbi:MAG: hypothetical protein B7Y26_05915 [Hydrogenophilales bacterium 16-64-46]|nr:MAG: hypothetical protein B7Z32_00705 [Hydrogenophilales bacterium 12-64-13]OYZ05856.1 MAG: hypothetical protein B7Y26_05915 [Hydrogenophilales bacterium 16-64-46]OZA39792.1 MAG: hypothetical protein B7X87_01940 [Hydrogenophilales bacterium 17-64-34]HQS98665.1 DUF4426 domain-containing protein [Thiobacillus sp.]